MSESLIEPIFAITFVGILIFIAYSASKQYQKDMMYFKSLKQGTRVKILGGYFEGKEGLVKQYIPHSLKQAAGFLGDELYQPEGITVQIEGEDNKLFVKSEDAYEMLDII